MAINPSLVPGAVRVVTDIIMACPRYDIEILEIEWLGGHHTARENITITGPHWINNNVINHVVGIFTNPIDFVNNEKDDSAVFHYATGALRAAVYEISSSATFTNPKVKVKLKTLAGRMFSQNDVGQAMTLQMSLDTLRFTEANFNLPALNATVELELALSDDSKNTVINTLQAISGDAIWTVTSATKSAPLRQRTRLEVFFIYAQPATFYTNGVWVEALRFLFRHAGIQGDSAVATTASKIATYCHSGHGLVYHTAGGAPAYGVRKLGGAFDLKKYLSKDAGNIVNCYDQAAAVQALCGALGVQTTWVHLDPHGFINTTLLVGVGRCNNPFFTAGIPYSTNPEAAMVTPLQLHSRYNAPLCTDGMIRSDFARHSFIKLNDNNHIIDACAGPALATESLAGYKASTIDSVCNSLTRNTTGVADETGSVTSVEW